MIYGLASWKRLSPTQPWLLVNGSTIVVQRPKFLTLPATYILGIILAIVGFASLTRLFFSQELTFTFTALSSDHILAGICIALGIWVSIQARAGTTLRKEQGGVHPNDMLIVFDGTAQHVIRQQGTTQERIGTFADMQLNIRVDRSGKGVKYRIEAIFPQKTERIATTSNKTYAEKLLEEIKTHLLIT